MKGVSERSAGVRPGSRWLALVLTAAGVAVYANSLSVPFLFDDVTWIVR